MTSLLLACSANALAVLFVTRPGVPGTRRLLAVVLAFVVPGVGLLLAFLVLRVRGVGVQPEAEIEQPRARPVCAADVRRLCDLPPLLERLMSPNSTVRLAALIGVSATGGEGAIAALRWTVEHGTPEVVLDAALTLEELALAGNDRREKDPEMELLSAVRAARLGNGTLRPSGLGVVGLGLKRPFEQTGHGAAQ